MLVLQLKLVGKPIVNFLLAVIEHFLLAVMVAALWACNWSDHVSGTGAAEFPLAVQTFNYFVNAISTKIYHSHSEYYITVWCSAD